MAEATAPEGAGAAPPPAPALDVGKTASVIRDWLKFIVSMVSVIAGVVIWFYSQIGAIEDDVKVNYVSKEIHTEKIATITEKLTALSTASVTKADLALLKQQVDSLQRSFDSYVKQEGESWAAVKKSSKEIRDLVTQIQLTLARLTR